MTRVTPSDGNIGRPNLGDNHVSTAATPGTPAAEEPPIERSHAAQLAHHAAHQPTAPAITVGTETVDFATFDRRANQMARVLADHGVTPGDFVTIAEPNSVHFLVGAAACWKMGAIPQPVSSRLPRLELAAIIDLADPAAVIGVEVEGRTSFPLGFEPGNDISSDPLPDIISPAWKAPTSGGSTGTPKLIVSGDPSVFSAGHQAQAQLLGATGDDTMVMPGPLYHNGPFIWSCLTLLSGGHLVLLPRFDAEGTLAAVQDHKATSIYLVPTMMQRMWKLPEDSRDRYDLTSLRVAFHLAEPCPAWLKEVWIDWIGAEVLWELYGGTEGQASTVLSGTEWLAHRGSVGRPSAGEIKIFDDDGNEVEAGVTGEVWMRPTEPGRITYRYIGAEAEARDGWECLGDIGWMDEDGYLYLADRRKDMILVGGANVYPAEIESAINSHPNVASCAVIGLPDEDKGNLIHAIVQPHGELTDDDLREFLVERLVRYKQPRTFEYVDEPLRDDAGKVRRAQLQAERMTTNEVG